MSEQEISARKQAAEELATPIVREILLGIIGQPISEKLFISTDVEIRSKLEAAGLAVAWSKFEHIPRTSDAIYHLELFVPDEDSLFMDFGIQQESFV